jgi:hydrogenase expression/formation protein HypD
VDEKVTDLYRDPDLARDLVRRIVSISRKKIRLMEVCGTHTVSIFRNGIRSLLPDTISLISGPGCPVCVTDQGEIDTFMALAGMAEVTVATFGDLMRVPGSGRSLLDLKAMGRDIRVVYSPLDALDLARKNPDRKVVFLGVGFETTAPIVAGVLSEARRNGIDNFLVYCTHKLVPPALEVISRIPDVQVDGFLLPGHVSAVLGTGVYRPIVEKTRIPAVVAGFEPVDLLQAIGMLVAQIEAGEARLENAYRRVVPEKGNPTARAIMDGTFQVVDTSWRGLGVLPKSGLALKPEFAGFDAGTMLPVSIADPAPPAGCRCGDVLTGKIEPPGCSLFGTACRPSRPMGPCMVSSEGSCSAFYRFGGV